jgi:hypothetical protein
VTGGTEEVAVTTIYVDDPMPEDERRRRLYSGDLFVFSARPSTDALIGLARTMLEEAFAPFDPISAQYELPVERFVEIFAAVKPAFIHHPRTLEFIAAVLDDFGCDDETTYMDVPRYRGVTSDGYLTSGVGYAHHPHRDTWYSAPMCQLNWWIPVYTFAGESSMAFIPRYFDAGVENGSDEFNYYEWNKTGRASAAQHINQDTRKQPKATAPLEEGPEIRVVCPPGGIILFAGAQMHATVPNTTGRSRFSLDFRTVNVDDLINGAGAPNADSHPTGTSLRDFVKVADRTLIADDLVRRYDHGASDEDGVLVFRPA